MGSSVLGLEEINQAQIALVGGKGANWGSSRGSKAYACRPAFA